MPQLAQWSDLDRFHLSILDYVARFPGMARGDVRADTCPKHSCGECRSRIQALIDGGFLVELPSAAGFWPMDGLFLTRSGVDGLAREARTVTGLRLVQP